MVYSFFSIFVVQFYYLIWEYFFLYISITILFLFKFMFLLHSYPNRMFVAVYIFKQYLFV